MTSVNRFLWDTMQSTFGCCGADGQDDWSAAKELPNGEKVPISCCKDPNDCNVYSPTASEIWMEGCVPKLELYYRIAFWALPSVMAFMLLAALIVCSGQKSREQRHAKNRLVKYLCFPFWFSSYNTVNLTQWIRFGWFESLNMTQSKWLSQFDSARFSLNRSICLSQSDSVILIQSIWPSQYDINLT